MQLYADGASIESMNRLAVSDDVDGFTTNPSLLAAEGVRDYAAFGREAMAVTRGKAISFEVIADTLPEMSRQASIIAAWGPNVYVKIPVMNTKGESTAQLVRQLALEGVQVNVTAVFTPAQVDEVLKMFVGIGTPAILSIFAGRIADTLVDPCRLIRYAQAWQTTYRSRSKVKILWASTREIGNYVHAYEAGADIITMSPSLIDKAQLLYNKDLTEYARETVTQFLVDGQRSGFTL